MIQNVPYCSGCSACANICLQNAISMQPSKEGFLIPIVNKDLCSKCGLCVKICPVLNLVENDCVKEPKAFAAKINDEDIRLQSSSGGVFTALAQKVIEENGVVFGAALDKGLNLFHIGVETTEELSKLRGSKYFQSQIGDTYKQVKSLLLKERPVLYSGTPCQIAGLYAYLRNKKYQNLVTVDVICHGAPTPKLFKIYKQEIEEKNKGILKEINFRNKNKGWKSYSITKVIANNSDEVGCNNEISDTLKDNVFMRLFLKDICLRESCHHCTYSKIPRIADITLGDYWGIQNIHPDFDDDKGTSLVLLNSKTGEALWNKVQENITIIPTDLKTAIKHNPSVQSSCKSHPKRKDFFEQLGKEPLQSLANRYCRKPNIIKRLIKKCLRKTKKIIKRDH